MGASLCGAHTLSQQNLECASELRKQQRHIDRRLDQLMREARGYSRQDNEAKASACDRKALRLRNERDYILKRLVQLERARIEPILKVMIESIESKKSGPFSCTAPNEPIRLACITSNLGVDALRALNHPSVQSPYILEYRKKTEDLNRLMYDPSEVSRGSEVTVWELNCIGPPDLPMSALKHSCDGIIAGLSSMDDQTQHEARDTIRSLSLAKSNTTPILFHYEYAGSSSSVFSTTGGANASTQPNHVTSHPTIIIHRRPSITASLSNITSIRFRDYEEPYSPPLSEYLESIDESEKGKTNPSPSSSPPQSSISSILTQLSPYP